MSRLVNSYYQNHRTKIFSEIDLTYHRLCSEHFSDGNTPQPATGITSKIEEVFHLPEPTKAVVYKLLPLTNSLPSSESHSIHGSNIQSFVNPSPTTGPFLATNCLQISTQEHVLDNLNKDCLIKNLREQIDELRMENMELKKRALEPAYKGILRTNSDCLYYTGFNTTHIFVKTAKYIMTNTELKFESEKGISLVDKRTLVSIDGFLLTTMKLRLNLKNKDLSKRLRIRYCRVTSIFVLWLDAMRRTIGLGIKLGTNDISEKKDTAASQPRILIDCTELSICTPRDSDVKKYTQSGTKNGDTVKFLVAVTPESQFAFISSVYGGTASDKEVVMTSKILDSLDPFDVILADRNCNIQEECDERNLNLLLSPRDTQTKEIKIDAKRTKRRSKNQHFIIEQSIHRLKRFAILNSKITLQVVPELYKVILACASICNQNILHKNDSVEEEQKSELEIALDSITVHNASSQLSQTIDTSHIKEKYYNRSQSIVTEPTSIDSSYVRKKYYNVSYDPCENDSSVEVIRQSKTKHLSKVKKHSKISLENDMSASTGREEVLRSRLKAAVKEGCHRTTIVDDTCTGKRNHSKTISSSTIGEPNTKKSKIDSTKKRKLLVINNMNCPKILENIQIKLKEDEFKKKVPYLIISRNTKKIKTEDTSEKHSVQICERTEQSSVDMQEQNNQIHNSSSLERSSSSNETCEVKNSCNSDTDTKLMKIEHDSDRTKILVIDIENKTVANEVQIKFKEDESKRKIAYLVFKKNCKDLKKTIFTHEIANEIASKSDSMKLS